MALYFECYLETTKKKEKKQEEGLFSALTLVCLTKDQISKPPKKKNKDVLIYGGVFKSPGITCRINSSFEPVDLLHQLLASTRENPISQ